MGGVLLSSGAVRHLDQALEGRGHVQAVTAGQVARLHLGERGPLPAAEVAGVFAPWGEGAALRQVG